MYRRREWGKRRRWCWNDQRSCLQCDLRPAEQCSRRLDNTHKHQSPSKHSLLWPLYWQTVVQLAYTVDAVLQNLISDYMVTYSTLRNDHAHWLQLLDFVWQRQNDICSLQARSLGRGRGHDGMCPPPIRKKIDCMWFTLWFTLCSPNSRSTNQWGLGLSGLVHEEAHPTVPNTC